ncbi:MAG: hypothetical protein HPY50_16830, partial [Firmicutes bacterium]|nr:hypothetical protein [Bacillota bacterium]
NDNKQDTPTQTYYHKNGQARKLVFGYRDPLYGPRIVEFDEKGRRIREIWLIGGSRHREDGPAVILYDQYGNLKEEEYFLVGTKVSCREAWEESIKEYRRWKETAKESGFLLDGDFYDWKHIIRQKEYEEEARRNIGNDFWIGTPPGEYNDCF